MSTAEPADAGATVDAGLSGPDLAAVGALRAFASGRPAPATAVVNHLGRRGARIVVIAGDGTFGDAVVSSVDVATEVCARAGITVGSWDRETTARITPMPADRIKMRGTGR